MSLRKLKRDYAVEEEMSNVDGSMADYIQPRFKEQGASDSGNLIKLSSTKEVFDIDETKIKDGLTEENVGVDSSPIAFSHYVIFSAGLRPSFNSSTLLGCERR